MSNHVELKGEIISHSLLKVSFCRYLIVKVVEGVQPLVFGFDSSFYAEAGFCFNTTKPYVE